VSHVPLSTDEEFKAAVSAAKNAFPSWRNTPVTTRQRVMLKLQELIRRDMVSILYYNILEDVLHSFPNIDTHAIMLTLKSFHHISTLQLF
jgi:acyl-CoA reductase-like NAD-dependent aldehyde dehydrogenase